MIQKRILYQNINKELFFYLGDPPAQSLIDKINELGHLFGKYNDIVKIDNGIVTIDNVLSSNFKFVIPHLGYSNEDDQFFIWNKDNDPDEIECKRLHLFKI